MSDLQEKLQVTSTYNRNVEYQTWSICCNLFLIYADKLHTQIDQPLKVWFSDSRTFKICKSIKISIIILITIISGVGESNTVYMKCKFFVKKTVQKLVCHNKFEITN